MTYSKILRGNAGFTLVELMVAVGITGALSAVAVPNYLKYVAKSRQGEAKIALSAIYISEKQFGTEFGFYTSCLNKAGFVPQSDRYYAIGFTSAAATAANCGTPGNIACNSAGFSSACNASSLTGSPSDSMDTAYPALVKVGATYPTESTAFTIPSGVTLPSATTSGSVSNMTGVGKVAFSVGAAGSISNSGALDQWFINSNKTLINVRSGI